MRPVALPALAAAVQAVGKGTGKNGKLVLRQARPFVHEDDPQD